MEQYPNNEEYYESLSSSSSSGPASKIMNSNFVLDHGGKVLAIMIGMSAILFLILFYDSMCMNDKAMAVAPDMLTDLWTKSFPVKAAETGNPVLKT
jgi:hypothetical protein